MAYVDEAFYKDEYFGFKVPSNQFPYYSNRATEMVDSIISGDHLEGDDITIDVKKCTCAVMDIVYGFDNEKELSSETVGSYKRSFKDDGIKQSNDQKVYNVVMKYLSKTGLMYRGVDNVY